MRSQLYYLVRKLIGQRQRNRLKNIKYKISKRSNGIRKKWYGTFTAADLYRELKSKLPSDFEILMVHCSHSDMMPIYRSNLSDLLEVFLKLCGPEKTLVMPAFFFGARKYNYNVLDFFRDKGVFEVNKTPSQMGLLSELFRRYPNVKVSAHPTHRVCVLGKLADELIANHENCMTGCGKGSPFDKMASKNTIVIGSGIRYYQCMTQTHSPEDILIETGEYPTKFNLNTVNVNLKFEDGRSVKHLLTLPNKTPYQRRLHPFLRNLLNNNEMLECKFHGIPFFYANAGRVQSVLLDAARNGKSVYH